MYKSWKNTNDTDALSQHAIAAATASDWGEAVHINQKILAGQKDNVEALNRLARALICQGKIDDAKKAYTKVLELDPYNIIARKNLERVATTSGTIKNGQALESGGHHVPNLSSLFLFEPGKTKMASLLNLAPPATLAMLNCGEEVTIVPKNHSVSITTLSGTYLGALADDLAHHIISLTAGGNKYQAYVKSASGKSLVIFIRESYRSAKFSNQPSFQTQIASMGGSDYTIY